MDLGAQPYQDFELLVTVRDILVHYRPEVHPEGDEPETNELVRRRLTKKGLVPPQSSKASRFVFNDVANHNVAEWALKTALNMIVSVADLLPSPIGKLALSGYHAIEILHDENGT